MAAKFELVVCQNLAAEVRAILVGEALPEAIVTVLPARCHGPPVEKAAAPPLPAAAECDPRPAVWIGCRCLAEGLAPCVQAPPSPPARQCFELLAGRDFTDALARQGAYLLTPGWLACWEERLRGWGFDQAMAREFFSESISRLVLLDTGINPQSAAQLEAFAAFIQRPFEVIPIGLDHLRLALKLQFAQWQLADQAAGFASRSQEASHRLANLTMVTDMLGRLTSLKSESKVIEGILEIFTMLCAPAHQAYLPIGATLPPAASTVPLPDPTDCEQLRTMPGDYSWSDSQRGFALRVAHAEETMGFLKLEGFAFPQHRQHYLNLALNLTKVCGLAIHNARIYEQLQQNIHELEFALDVNRRTQAELETTVKQLQTALADVKLLSGMIPICSGCKKIRDDQGYWSQVECYIQKHSKARFTHGMCPDCTRKYFPDV